MAAYAGRITAVQFEAKCQGIYVITLNLFPSVLGKVVNDKPVVKAKPPQTFRPPAGN